MKATRRYRARLVELLGAPPGARCEQIGPWFALVWRTDAKEGSAWAWTATARDDRGRVMVTHRATRGEALRVLQQSMPNE